MLNPGSVTAGTAQYIPSNQSCAACRAYACGVHQSVGVRSLKPKRLQAMDAALTMPDRDGAETRNARVDRESLAINEKRANSGNDEGEIPRKKPTMHEQLDAQIDQSFKGAMGSIAALVRRRAMAARDAAIDASRREFERKQRAADRRAAKREELEQQSRQRTREILDPSFKRARDEAAKSAQIGELGPGGGSFAEQVKEEGRVQQNSNLRKLPPATAAPVQRHISAYEDHDGNYKGAGRRLMGQDAAPKTAEEKMLIEHKIARKQLERMWA